VQSAEFRDLMAKDGATTVGSSRAAFDRHLNAEQTRWRGLINDANIKLE
jgi:tripartite-type tricarboxylate transporter receptor subunit TctC